MDYEKLKKQWLIEEKASFKGWDFSHLDGRWDNKSLKWDYADIVKNYLKPDHRLLDMGTGGGEFLLTLNHPYNLTYVTESYPPNIELCLKILVPLGIGVEPVNEEDGLLPFETGFFDIIINRHESFNIAEVKRALKPGGYFITQQVGGKNGVELSSKLIPGFTGNFPDYTLKNNVDIAVSCGFEILTQYEDFPMMRFYDIGALAYYAKIIPWEFPEFSVESCFSRLCALQDEIEEKGFIKNPQHRFIIAVQKPI